MDGYAKNFSSCSGDGQQLQHIRQQQQQNQIFSSPTNCLADENLHIDYIILTFDDELNVFYDVYVLRKLTYL